MNKPLSVIFIALCASVSMIAAPKLMAQDAVRTTQTLPPVAPVAETPFARALTRLDDLEAQIRNLTNRLEIAESQLESQKSENARLAKIIDDTRASSIKAAEKTSEGQNDRSETSLSQVTPSEPKAQSADAELSSSSIGEAESEAIIVTGSSIAKPMVAAAAPNAAPIATAVSTPPAPKASPAAKPVVNDVPIKPASVLLADARLMLQRSEFAAAEAQLVLLTETYPDAPETPEGLWLLGETRFVQKAFNPAALAYVAYLGKAQNGPRASDSLLRLASAFREIGDNRQRCLAFNEYKKRTPNPTPVQAARASAELAKGPCN